MEEKNNFLGEIGEEQKPEIQKAKHFGTVYFIKKIPNGGRVEKGEEIYYLKGIGGRGTMVHASGDGIISGLPEEGAEVEEGKELFRITPTSEK